MTWIPYFVIAFLLLGGWGGYEKYENLAVQRDSLQQIVSDDRTALGEAQTKLQALAKELKDERDRDQQKERIKTKIVSTNDSCNGSDFLKSVIEQLPE